MVDQTTWFALGGVGMLVGTLALAAGFRLVPRSNWRRYSILVAVPAIAVGAYAPMALGLGGVETQSGGTVFSLRYLDWLLTTPLHVLYLGLLAGAARRSIGQAIALMALTIVLGFSGAVVSGVAGWGLFALGGVAFLGVIYHTYADFAVAAGERDELTGALYRKLRSFVVVLWLLYPVIWVLAPAGLGLLNVGTYVLVISYLDVVSKVGFGLIALSGQLAVSDAMATVEESTEATAD